MIKISKKIDKPQRYIKEIGRKNARLKKNEN